MFILWLDLFGLRRSAADMRRGRFNNRAVVVPLACLWLVAVGIDVPALAGPGSGQAAGKSSSSSPSASSSVPAGASSSSGVWYALSDTNQELAEPRSKAGLVILCYELQTTTSSTQPLIAVPRYQGQKGAKPSDSDCSVIDEKHPLLMRQYLVFKIKADTLPNTKQTKLLNLSVTSAAGTPSNPTPMRAAISQPTGINALDFTADLSKAPPTLNGIYYARWPYPLGPDTDITVSLNIVYPTPQPGARWLADTFYPAGSVVSLAAPSTRGHFFTALTSGMSGNIEPPFASLDIPDGSLSWVDLGTTAPDSKKTLPLWESDHDYKAGEVVESPWNAHFLMSNQKGRSGPHPPIAAVATQHDGDVIWQDAGINLSSSTPAPDQVVTVVNQSLPHVHALSYYNLSAGVVYSTVRNRTYGFDTSNNPTQTGTSPIIDPVLFFTYYPWPIDAERPFQRSDLRPGLSLGISLSSPSANFYIGGMSEIQRNVQLVYGFTVAKVSHLAPANTFNPTPSGSSTTPATVQKFDKGAYVGLSFNFAGFVSSLFNAGGGH
jgi:hypothetical protein